MNPAIFEGEVDSPYERWIIRTADLTASGDVAVDLFVEIKVGQTRYWATISMLRVVAHRPDAAIKEAWDLELSGLLRTATRNCGEEAAKRLVEATSGHLLNLVAAAYALPDRADRVASTQ